MAIYQFPITQAQADALQDRSLDVVHNYLVNNGITVNGVSLTLNPPTLIVDAEQDPTTLIQNAPWPTKRNTAQAKQAIKTFMNAQNPTQQETINALRGVIVLAQQD